MKIEKIMMSLVEIIRRRQVRQIVGEAILEQRRCAWCGTINYNIKRTIYEFDFGVVIGYNCQRCSFNLISNSAKPKCVIRKDNPLYKTYVKMREKDATLEPAK